jgi:hypothetical protein
MTYLSYPNASNTPEPSAVVDVRSKFQQSGNLLTLKGIELGYNVTIFGVLEPDGLVNFDKRPTFRGADIPFNLADTGRLHPQSDGTVAIEWPL